MPEALNAPKFPALMNSSPTVAMNSSGTNLTTVVTSCAAPMLRTPERFTIAGTHRPAIAIAIDHPVEWPLFQKTST